MDDLKKRKRNSSQPQNTYKERTFSVDTLARIARKEDLLTFEDKETLSSQVKQLLKASNGTTYLEQYPFLLRYLDSPTSEQCLAAVQGNGYILQYVKEQTPDICLAAVQQQPWALKYVKEQTPELCLIAVQQDGVTLQFVKHQTPEICLTAVQKNGLALQRVVKQTPEICLAAVRQNGIALRYVQTQTSEICSAAVRQNDSMLKYVKERLQKKDPTGQESSPPTTVCNKITFKHVRGEAVVEINASYMDEMQRYPTHTDLSGKELSDIPSWVKGSMRGFTVECRPELVQILTQAVHNGANFVVVEMHVHNNLLHIRPYKITEPVE